MKKEKKVKKVNKIATDPDRRLVSIPQRKHDKVATIARLQCPPITISEAYEQATDDYIEKHLDQLVSKCF